MPEKERPAKSDFNPRSISGPSLDLFWVNWLVGRASEIGTTLSPLPMPPGLTSNFCCKELCCSFSGFIFFSASLVKQGWVVENNDLEANIEHQYGCVGPGFVNVRNEGCWKLGLEFLLIVEITNNERETEANLDGIERNILLLSGKKGQGVELYW